MKTDMLKEANSVYRRYFNDDVVFILDNILNKLILSNNEDYLKIILNKDYYHERIWKWLESGKIFYKPYKSKKQKKIETYLKKLNKSSAYYKTMEWKNLRKQALIRDCFKCVECGSNNKLHVHHTKYKHRSKKLEDLMTLCKYCHAKKHPINGKGILNF